MTDDSDKRDKALDDNETLVNALESIKSLLATSETKLSQARASISQASAKSMQMNREVPVLDNVIVPGKPQGELAPESSDTPPATDNTPPPASQDLASFKAELEQEMHDKLASYAAKLEEELKARIQAFLEQAPSPD